MRRDRNRARGRCGACEKRGRSWSPRQEPRSSHSALHGNHTALKYGSYTPKNTPPHAHLSFGASGSDARHAADQARCSTALTTTHCCEFSLPSRCRRRPEGTSKPSTSRERTPSPHNGHTARSFVSGSPISYPGLASATAMICSTACSTQGDTSESDLQPQYPSRIFFVSPLIRLSM